MPLIELETLIAAPPERCFDLARSIDFHMVTAGSTGETAVAGRTSGLIELGERVTWRAKHLGVWQHLSVKITELTRPAHFRDEMTRGAFASMCHDHDFTARDGHTVMRDRFDYRSPLGPLGPLVDWLFLEQYLRRFLVLRAGLIKSAAESDQWKRYV